jgi:hypothetical protein
MIGTRRCHYRVRLGLIRRVMRRTTSSCNKRTTCYAVVGTTRCAALILVVKEHQEIVTLPAQESLSFSIPKGVRNFRSHCQLDYAKGDNLARFKFSQLVRYLVDDRHKSCVLWSYLQTSEPRGIPP